MASRKINEAAETFTPFHNHLGVFNISAVERKDLSFDPATYLSIMEWRLKI
jgi:hypothetical protein